MNKNLFIVICFAALSVFLTWPLILHLNNLIIDQTDGLLITWILNWGIAHPLNFNANIFYPFADTLAFSDLQWPLAFLTAPFVKITGEPLVAYNLSILLGLFLTPVSMYFLLKYFTNDQRISFLGSIIFSFNPMRLGYIAHPQLLNFWPVVFATMFLWQKKYLLYIFFFILSALTTPLFLYFLILIGVIGKIREIGVICLASIIAAPFLLPYFIVSRTFNYVRPITDAIHFSLQFPDLLNLRPDGMHAFVGVGFLVLLIWGIRGIRGIWGILVIISLVLALGPALHIFTNTVHLGPIPAIPLPYAILYYIVPGFSGLRTPSRWILLTTFALIIALTIHFKNRINKKVLALLALLILLEAPYPLKFYQVPSVRDFPPEQTWLKDNYVGEPIVQFPIYGWWQKESLEPQRMYYSTIHWHPMYNGFSGFSPKVWEDSVRWLQKEFPSNETIRFLKEKGIKLVLDERKLDLKLIKNFPNTNIYELN